jgi:ribosome-associated protein
LTVKGHAARLAAVTAGLRVDSRITIPLEEIELRYVRSSGPGGQNVNKVASKAVLRFDLRGSPSIPETARRRALARLAARLTQRGEIVLSSGAHRDQPRNRETVIERLRELLADAVRAPRRRVPTRPTSAARKRRLESKRARGRLKRERAQRDEPPA